MRRPFHALACAGTAVHHGFELGCGVGLVFQPWLGLTGAAALWGTQLPAWFAATQARSERWNGPVAFGSGMALGAAVLHYAVWPWTLRGAVPYLEEAEGLRRSQLPAYNAILWLWAAAAAIALARETPRGVRRWGAAGFVAALAFRPAVRHHFEWLGREAKERPAWWNRALAA